MIVSIIIPIYKVEKYIERCLISVINQSFADIEMILIDDYGNDKSMQIALNVLKSNKWEHKSKIITHNKNRGLSAARNSGIKEASGDYIYFLDSDDSISIDCIEKLIKPALKYKNDFVIGDYKCIYNSQEIFTEKPPLKLNSKNISTKDKILISFQNGEWYEMAVNKLIRRSFLIDNDLFFTEGIIHEDVLWSFKMACKAQSMSVINECTYYYYLRDDSITGLLHNDKSEEKKLQLRKSNESKIQIVRYMYDYITEPDLFDNIYVQSAFEIKKDIIFYTILKSYYYSNNVLYQIYCYFKNLRYISYSTIKKVNPDSKTQIKFFHYIFPSYIGFLIYKIIAKFRK